MAFLAQSGHFVERVIEWLGGASKSLLEQRITEAYHAGYNDGGEDEPVSGTTARQGYRRATTAGLRDFSQIEHAQMLEIVWTLWQSNPLAKRGLIIKRDYIVGRGVQYQTDDNALKDILDSFWEINQLGKRITEFALQLFLFGEQCYPVFVRQTDGQVRIGYIDPESIDEVITHPENALEMCAVVIKPQEGVKTWQARQDKRVYRIIRQGTDVPGSADLQMTADQASMETQGARQSPVEPWETEMLKAFGLTEYTGDCFYHKVNSVSNQPRGYSDLLQVADWLDQHDETLFALADREQMAGYFSWDVTLAGADAAKIAARAKELRASPPKKGSVNCHNDSETWQFNYPDLKQTASIETANALLTFVLGGLGLPRHWYGYGDETNRATAQAQGDPTWRSLAHDQGIVHDMILGMLEFARDQAQLAGAWQPALDPETQAEGGEITVTMPEMTVKDVTTISAAIAQLATALIAVVDQGWLTTETATTLLAKLMAEFGVEVDAAQELEKAAADQEQRGVGQAQQPNDWLTSHGVLQPAGAMPGITQAGPELAGGNNGNAQTGIHQTAQ
jgi:hypothetical protein